ncbi:HAD family phosphatase [Streptomyces sp. BPTC-684]|uniref:HAD family hydrolase n=1 Tax=Streptomyces sp. BPTC-684 TaxID=3043734 RepID=UPI0024B08080|nr:HAD family phosphatase [Streptomyces sp. BPTC-684]WHM40486.1 HAD family phosphatase [Streptomyces sp. BPTC-684]
MDSRCVILDIGGVLEITPDTGWVPRWEERLGLPPGTVEERLEDVWQAGSIGAIAEREVHEQVARRLRLDAPSTAAFMGDLWAEYLGTPNEELIAYVRTLRRRCRLGILSNSFVGARERETELYRFDELVEQIVYSHEIGVSKPDPQSFAVTCARLGVRPQDCLFIDDFAPNIEAAQEAGMHGHLFEDNARATARIETHLAGQPSAADRAGRSGSAGTYGRGAR